MVTVARQGNVKNGVFAIFPDANKVPWQLKQNGFGFVGICDWSIDTAAVHCGRRHQGFSATTLPFFQTMSGVPCILAVLRATLAERRKARPTGVRGALRYFLLSKVIMGQLPAIQAWHWNYHTLPSDLPALNKRFRNYSTLVHSDAKYPSSAHYVRPASPLSPRVVPPSVVKTIAGKISMR